MVGTKPTADRTPIDGQGQCGITIDLLLQLPDNLAAIEQVDELGVVKRIEVAIFTADLDLQLQQRAHDLGGCLPAYKPIDRLEQSIQNSLGQVSCLTDVALPDQAIQLGHLIENPFGLHRIHTPYQSCIVEILRIHRGS